MKCSTTPAPRANRRKMMLGDECPPKGRNPKDEANAPKHPYPVKLSRRGLPINADDWTELDWEDLYRAMERAIKNISARHRKLVEPSNCFVLLNGKREEWPTTQNHVTGASIRARFSVGQDRHTLEWDDFKAHRPTIKDTDVVPWGSKVIAVPRATR